MDTDNKYDQSFRQSEIGKEKEIDESDLYRDEHYEDDLDDHLEELDSACIPDYSHN